MIDALVKSTDVKSQPSNFTSVKWLSAKVEEVKSTFINSAPSILEPLKSVSLKSILPFAFFISLLNDSISVSARLTNSSFDNIVLLTPS